MISSLQSTFSSDWMELEEQSLVCGMIEVIPEQKFYFWQETFSELCDFFPLYSSPFPFETSELRSICITLKKIFPEMDWTSWKVEISSELNSLTEVDWSNQCIHLSLSGYSMRELLLLDLIGNVMKFLHFQRFHDLEQSIFLSFSFLLQSIRNLPSHLQKKITLQIEEHFSNHTELLFLSRKIVAKGIPSFPYLKTFGHQNLEFQWLYKKGSFLLERRFPKQDWSFLQSPDDWEKQSKQVQKEWSLGFEYGWESFTSPIVSCFYHYCLRQTGEESSTEKRLLLLKTYLELMTQSTPSPMTAVQWALLSSFALEQERFPLIGKSIREYVNGASWEKISSLSLSAEEKNLQLQSSIRNKLSQEEHRFYQQAVDLMVIWKDVLHRNDSESWPRRLLFQALEDYILLAHQNPFALLLPENNDVYAKESFREDHPELKNLNTLLELLAQSPQEVCLSLFKQEKENWPLLQKYLLHSFQRLPLELQFMLEQVQEDAKEGDSLSPNILDLQLELEKGLSEREVHGRILPLLEHLVIPDGYELQDFSLLRVFQLDSFLADLHEKENHSVASCYVLLFKKKQSFHLKDWLLVGLWIQKSLDEEKLSLSESPVFWEAISENEQMMNKTYHYQFASLDYFLNKYPPSRKQWKSLFMKMMKEFQPLFSQLTMQILYFHSLGYFYSREKQNAFHKNRTLDWHEKSYQLSFHQLEQKFPLIEHLVWKHIEETLQIDEYEEPSNWTELFFLLEKQFHLMENLLFEPGGLLLESSSQHWLTEKIFQALENHPDEGFSLEMDEAEATVSFESSERFWPDFYQKLLLIHPSNALTLASWLLEQIDPWMVIEEFWVQQKEEDASILSIWGDVPTSLDKQIRLKTSKGDFYPDWYIQSVLSLPKEIIWGVARKGKKHLLALEVFASLLFQHSSSNEDEELIAQFASWVELLRSPSS